jgi:hypothetical protein
VRKHLQPANANDSQANASASRGDARRQRDHR